LISLATQLTSAGAVLGSIAATTRLASTRPSASAALALLVVASTLIGYDVFSTLRFRRRSPIRSIMLRL
jgi:hypothetical protein